MKSPLEPAVSRVALCLVWALLASPFAHSANLFLPNLNINAADASPTEQAIIRAIKARPTSASVQVVQVDTKALLDEKLTVNLPNLASTTFVRSDFRGPLADQPSIAARWVGAAENVGDHSTIVSHDGLVTGSIHRGGKLYRIEPVSKTKQAIVEVKTSALPRDHPPSFKEIEKRGKAHSASDKPVQAMPQSLVTIDVLVAYTPRVARQKADILGLIRLAIRETNESYSQSGIKAELRLVGTKSVPYDESGKSYETILADFSSNKDIATARDNLGADVVVMLVDQGEWCGLSKGIEVTAADAYAIVYYDCATGYYSFGHEIGHIQGARHNPSDDDVAGYAHGYQDTKATPPWRTIMAYNCPDDCERLQYWANPNLQYKGRSMGTAALENDARKLNETAATVAGFRPTRQ